VRLTTTRGPWFRTPGRDRLVGQGRPWERATLTSYADNRFPKRGWPSAARSVQQSDSGHKHRRGEKIIAIVDNNGASGGADE
jgi:hypothetical protein